MICEREEEIARFKPREYWTVDADVEKAQQAFPARLIEYRGEKVEQFTVTTSSRLPTCARDRSRRGRQGQRRVDRAQAAPPQSGAAVHDIDAAAGAARARLRRATHDALAQQLYEGVDFGEGAVGLITYMRTDSLNLANEALQEIRQVIVANYGQESLPTPRVYKTNRRTRRKRTKRSDRRPPRSRRSGSKARSTPTSSSCTA